MMAVLQLQLPDNLFIKDPQTTELGKKIVRESIRMIDQLGFESFTFRKLSIEIDSTEASIYRYFENKHRLLLYLITWYWAWLEYRIEYNTHHISDPIERLEKIIKIVCDEPIADDAFPDINEVALSRIVTAESDKTYLTKQVDQDNEEGLFKGYKNLCHDIAMIIRDINPKFEYPHALVSTILEASSQQIFFARHLPSLTEIKNDKSIYHTNYKFLKSLVFKTIQA
ncbi:MAG: TetR/AcrR family transcriptional regulator [Cyclobacteriaceae bacterium]